MMLPCPASRGGSMISGRPDPSSSDRWHVTYHRIARLSPAGVSHKIVMLCELHLASPGAVWAQTMAWLTLDIFKGH